MSVIQLRGLTKYYGKAKGVQNIELDVGAGEVFGFIGPNGAGKSTTIRMIMQLIKPSSGHIYVLGRRLEDEIPEVRRQIGYLPSEINLYKDLTGKQVLEFAARAHGLELNRTRAAEYADLLAYDMNKRIKSYSLGNRKKLGILLALLHEPGLLILDEPTSGLDPLIQHAFFGLLQRLNERGTTIFFSTHILSEVEKICHRVAIIREGSLVRTSRVEEIIGQSRPIFTVRFKEEGNLIERCGLRHFDPSAKYEGGVHTFATGDVNETLHAIARFEIADLNVRKPTLDELFMGYYEHEKGGKVQ